MADLFELQASLTLDTDEYDEALDEAINGADDLVTALSGIGEGTGEAEGALSDVSGAISDTGNESSNSSALVDLLTKAFGDSDTAAAILSGDLTAIPWEQVAEAVINCVEEIAKFVDEMTQLGDAVDKGSQKVNFSAETYQKWSYIAQLCGTSIDTIRSSMRTLTSATVNDSEAFEQLGLTMDEVNSMSQEQLFEAVIYALANMEAGANRTALAQQLLGRNVIELSAILNSGVDGLDSMTESYNDLNGAMSDNMVTKSAELQDSLTNLSFAWQGVKARIAEFLITALPVANVINGIAKAIGGIGQPASEIDQIKNEMQQLAVELDLGAISAEYYEARMAELGARLAELQAEADGATGEIEDLNSATEDLGETSTVTAEQATELATTFADAYEECAKRVQDYWDTFETASTEVTMTVDEMTAAVQSQIDWSTNYHKNLETIMNSGIKGVDGLVASISTMGTDGAGYAQALADAINEGDTAAVEALIEKMGELTSAEDSLTALQSTFTDAFNAMKDAAEGDITAVQSMIDALHGKDVVVNVIEKYIGGGIDGSHAGGLDYVPKNDYVARLHEGEAVLTKSEAEDWRNGQRGGNVTTNIYAQDLSEAQIDYIVAEVNRQLGGAA